MANYLANTNCAPVIGPYAVAGVKTGFQLNSDASFTGSDLSGGAAIAWRFIAPATTTVTDVVFYVHTAPASAHNLTVLVCAAESGQATRVGAYLTNGYVNVSGGTTSDKWVKATFATPPSISVGGLYWICICDENYDAGNIYQIMSRTIGPSIYQCAPCYTSTDGFTTNGTAVASPPALAIAFGDGTYLGQPYTARTNSTSNQVYRGAKYTPPEDITLGGLMWVSSAAMATSGTIAIFQNGSGSVLAAFNGGSAFTIPTDANAAATNNYFRFPAVTLTGGTTYRIVVKPGGNDTDPQFFEIGDYATHQTILEGCGISSDGSFIWTYHDGGGDLSTNWTDETFKIPSFGLMPVTMPAVTGGGGGSYVFIG